MNPHVFFIPIIIFLLPFLLFLWMNKKREEAETTSLPPGPRKLPVIGNMHQLGKLPHRSLHRLSKEYGPLMFLQLGYVPTIVVSSADTAREIFKKYDQVFSGRPVLSAANKLSYNGSGISFAPYGDCWREVRKIVVLEILSAKRVQSFQKIRKEEVAVMINSIARSLSTPVNLSKLTLLLANSVICGAAFGVRKSSIHEILRETQEMLGTVNIADFFPMMGWVNKLNGMETRLENNFRELDRFYDRVIEEHRDPNRTKPDDREDLVDVLLRVQKDPTQAIALGDEQIKGVLTEMFIAGTDTSAATLVWIMTELIKNPSTMRKAQDEVREAVKGKGTVDEVDLTKLVYLKLVVKEALRLHPPAPLLLPRETTESCTIGGYKIPAKTRVFFNATSLALDPKYWENPNDFCPERFLDSSIDIMGGRNFEMLPLGAGRRGCPGANFSFVLVELALANLLCRFDWTLPQGMREQDIDTEEAVGITIHKHTPLLLVASAADM